MCSDLVDDVSSGLISHLAEYFIEIYHGISTSARGAGVSGSQKVMFMSRYISIAVASSPRVSKQFQQINHREVRRGLATRHRGALQH